MTRYISTRKAGAPVPFREALLAGLAPDGGLYVPQAIPTVPDAAWRGAPDFATMAAEVLRHWLAEEVAPSALERLVHEALNFEVPVVPLDGDGWEGVRVLELFHGPTLSFKDFGARTMARLMGHFLAERGERLTILVATSGDTGSAVADGFAGQETIRVVLLYPKGQVSPTQERQLIVRRPGVRSFAVEGTFDDCQRMVKGAFLDPDMGPYNLSSANSINIGRLLPQMLYYRWAAQQEGAAVPIFCVPSGNLGNLTGGVLAALSGMPVRRFVAAHNANDFFPRLLASGNASMGDSVRTLSNAMDVGAPSNFERLQALLPGDALAARIWGVSVSDQDTVATMRQVYEETGYLADPHTAVGLKGIRAFRVAHGQAQPAIVLSTAHPAKFPETITSALGVTPDVPPRLARFWTQETEVYPLQPTVEALKGAVVDWA